MGAETVDDALADLLAEDGIGRDTFFFDETFDLFCTLSVHVHVFDNSGSLHLQCPVSS
jgi:hypothetical protein